MLTIKAEEYYNHVLDIDPHNEYAKKHLKAIISAQKIQVGEVYDGVVKSILNSMIISSCLIELIPSHKEGEIYISRLRNCKPKRVEDVVHVGDSVRVKVLNIDEKGRINLTMRENDVLTKEEKQEKICQYKKHRDRLSYASRLIAVGHGHIIGLRLDGTVIAEGQNDYGQCNVSDWTNIVAISAGAGYSIGLREDGTVLAVGFNEHGQCNVEKWTNIVAISAGESHTIGLRTDGTVLATGKNAEGQCNVNNWADIIAVAAGETHTVGLRSNGTVVVVGRYDSHSTIYDPYNFSNNIYDYSDIENWSNIVDIALTHSSTFGLRTDGTVTVAGNFDSLINVTDWTDVVAITARCGNVVGLKSDGSVVAEGVNFSGECNVQKWKDIVAIFAGLSCTVGLKSDGTVIDAGLRAGGVELQKWKLFRSYENIEQERVEAKNRLEAERQRQEAERQRQEAERQSKIAELNTQKQSLQMEIANCKGLFSGGKRKELEARLAQIEKELSEL